MTTPVFPIINGVSFVSAGSSRKMKARVLKAQFGSGYLQRSGDGLNSVSATFSLSVTNLTRTESATLDAFLIERAGWQAFYFTPPGQSLPLLFTSEEWGVSHDEGGVIDSFTATFEQVFSP